MCMFVHTRQIERVVLSAVERRNLMFRVDSINEDDPSHDNDWQVCREQSLFSNISLGVIVYDKYD